MAENNNLPIAAEATTEKIQNLIYIIRGKQVMIDSDLAMLYCVETRTFVDIVTLNILAKKKD